VLGCVLLVAAAGQGCAAHPPAPAPGTATAPEPAPARARASKAVTGSIRGRLAAPQPPLLPDVPRVVTARPVGGAETPRRPDAVWRRVSGTFTPRLLVVSTGQTVRIRNDESICHRPFSSSTGNAFELPLLDPGDVGKVSFDEPGLVRVYCSLHAGEQASILVVPTPYFAVVGPTGEFALDGLPPGTYELVELHGARPAGSLRATVPGDGQRVVEIPSTRWPAGS
jgi:hypothetical protein